MKAILLVTSGISCSNTLNKTIKQLEQKIKNTFTEFELRYAFTSEKILEDILNDKSFNIENTEKALEKIYLEGYREVFIQSLHIIPGVEFEKLKDIVKRFSYINCFDRLVLGKPLLYKNNNSIKDDYGRTIKALDKLILKPKETEAVIFLGHGSTDDYYNRVYDNFQSRLKSSGFTNAYVVTTKNYLDLDELYDNLKNNNINKIHLVPFMFFAGGHIEKYMVGDMKESLKNILLKKGFEVVPYMRGFGENSGIQKIFLEHLKECF